MPYVTSAPRFCTDFPPGCPFCGAAEARGFYQQPYAKMKLSKIPGHATSESGKIPLPACLACAHWFRFSRIALFVLGGLALLWPIAAFAFDTKPGDAVWLCWIAGWVLVMFWRRHRTAAFRVAYVGESEIVYAARDERYANSFAHRNGLAVERRALVVRFS